MVQVQIRPILNAYYSYGLYMDGHLMKAYRNQYTARLGMVKLIRYKLNPNVL